VESTYFSLVRSSLTMQVLIVLSVFVFTIVMERFWYLRRSSVDARKFLDKVKKLVLEKSFPEAVKLCEKHSKPLLNVIKVGIINRHLPKSDADELMNSARLEEKAKLEKFLLFLGSMGAIGPLLGLLGTVVGLSRAFRDLALSGSAGPSVVAAGISEALYATITGLAIAIPTVLFYNFLMGRARAINNDIEISSKRLLVWLYADESAHKHIKGASSSDVRDELGQMPD
jgi:biopolymer transport protein ExbB